MTHSEQGRRVFYGAMIAEGVIALVWATAGVTCYESSRALMEGGAVICGLDYDVVWRYFSWANQTLAAIALWTFSIYLKQHGKNFRITAIPACFMIAEK